MPGKSVLAHHLIWTLYGHWLANDPRGSGSEGLIDDKFAPLGPVHRGRKPEHQQPNRTELRQFHREAEPILTHEVFWIHEAERRAIAESVAEGVERHRYTVWACAILANHMHMVIRRHRDDGKTIWLRIAERVRTDLRGFNSIAVDHPIWAARPYGVFLYSQPDIQRCVRYVAENPGKEGLPSQHFPFVQAYDGWPFRRK